MLYLQLLDFLTTVLVIVGGGSEVNPLVRRLMHLHGVYGLVLAKVLVAAFALTIAYHNRTRLLNRLTRLYALIILWNVTMAIFAAAAKPV